MPSRSISIINCGPDPIAIGSRCFDRFMQIPQFLYPKEALPLQALNDGINRDYLFQCLVVLVDNVPAGRCALYKNPLLRHHEKSCIAIGNYECTDDAEVSAALLNEAKKLAKEAGAQLLIGPLNGSTWDAYRFDTQPGKDLFFLEPYHLPHYAKQFEAAGFSTLADYVSTIDRTLAHDAPAVLKREKEFLDQGFRFRHILLDEYESELDRLYVFCRRAFAKNFLYTPVSREVFFNKYKTIKPFIKEEQVIIVEFPNGKTAGFVFCFHDHACRTEKRLVLKTLARDPSPETKGLGNVLGNRMTKYAAGNGYASIIHALMHVDNSSKNLSGQYSGEPLKQYKLYSLSL